MTVPSKPYATSSQVALLLTNLLKGAIDFSASTIPTKIAVEQYITWVSHQIDMQFQQAGYIVPFTELSGEFWPTHQTYYLQMVTALGAAALAGGWTLKPAPAVARGRDGSTGNVFQDLYNEELNKIWNAQFNSSNIRFRMMAYSGSVAERSITEPKAPSLDYLEGEMNPEDTFRLGAYTDLRYNMEAYVIDNLNYGNYWDTFYGLYSSKATGYQYVDNS